ncbi:MltA-interacting protein MipA [Roseivivax sp. THAF40]|uniref:MipA/OmpV family protein n=1 Tax=unclassified Roseivivax TaxID=2639302 RepID=UPI00126812AB|nr:MULTISPECIES: MipA/OmpV family protein [unclassified Roseivivax]QFS81407.1 MltA-interacting protein MipA [Roseivivax sp. THAF197b]QFT45136.1 MltA-interacting protein MipA [Roseivivax sp. THAF40]
MKTLISVAALAATLGASGATMAAAQSQASPGDPALSFTLRGGVASGPAYFGAEEYEYAPDLGFKFHSINIGPLAFGDPDPQAPKRGFGVGGSFRYIGLRDASEYDLLTGLDDIDPAYELGLGVSYATQNFSAFADLRRGFGGHQGVVGELGADVTLQASSEVTLTMGPRALFGDAEFTDTYFGVSSSEASALNPAYDAEGGLVSVGAEIVMTYQINDDWGIETGLTWDRYMNDAADSPIVENGRRDDLGARVGLTRNIQLGF